MSMMICGFCDTLTDTDYDCGEWDIKDRDGTVYDFVCESCACDDEEFIRCDNCDDFTTDDDSTLCEESDQRTCLVCQKVEHDKYLAMYKAETGKDPYKNKEKRT